MKLRDRVGAEHPLKADAGCRNTVFNSLAQTGAEYVARMLALGVRNFRVEFLNETPEQVAQTISKYRQLLRGEISGAQLWRELKLLNQLGVTRGQMVSVSTAIVLNADRSLQFTELTLLVFCCKVHSCLGHDGREMANAAVVRKRQQRCAGRLHGGDDAQCRLPRV